MNPARQVICPVCETAPATPCTAEGEHMARWVRAYDEHLVPREDMAAVFGSVPVITRTVIVPAERRAA